MREFKLRLHGDVGTDFTVGSVARELDKAGTAPLRVEVHSYGGEALGGIAIYHQLKRYAGRKRVVVDGVAASAASVIAMAGDEIDVPRNGFVMIHNAWSIAAGDADAVEQTAGVLRQVSHAMARIYAGRTGKSEDEILALMRDETWFDGDAAVAEGFATHASNPVELHASADRLARFHRVPAALTRAISHNVPAVPAHLESPMSVPNPSAAPPSAGPANPPSGGSATLAELRSLAAARPDVLGSDWVLDQLSAGATVQAARDAAFTALAQLTPPRGFTASVGADYDSPEARRGAMAEALASRMLNREARGPGQRYQGWSLAEIGREMLNASGTNTRGWSGTKVIETAISSPRGTLTTSDFPVLLRDAANRTLAEAYPKAQSPLRTALCRIRNATDFRPIGTARISDFPVLERVSEGAPVTFGSVSESKETYSVGTYGKYLNLTREILINDDLNAFGQALNSVASAAAEAEARELVGLLARNSGTGPTLSDGAPLFAVARGTLASIASTPDDASVGAGRLAMRKQADVDDTGPLGLSPKYMVVGPELESVAEKLLSVTTTLVDGSALTVSQFAGKVQLLVEPRVSGRAWWLFADPEQAPILEVAYLNGLQAPIVEQFETPQFFGVALRARHDFGAGVVGWRGAYRNPGAAS